MTDPRLVYIADPMCSWCWGFAPVIGGVAAHHGLAVSVVVGGLRPGPMAAPLDDPMRTYLRSTWSRIQSMTGQPFDHAFLDREDWVYDTELPAIAVAAFRELATDQTLAFLERLQRAFYAENTDITDPSVYPGLVAPFGVDADRFATVLGTEDAKRRAWEDFAAARKLGVSGFPTLLLERDGRRQLLTAGYRPAAEIEQFLAPLLA